MKKPIFLDLFAGAGGLSEGFIRAGYTPVAHVEMDRAACNTLKTRMAYHWLKNNNKTENYYKYIDGEIERSEFYKKVPEREINSVINEEINGYTLNSLFIKIDELLHGRQLDLIIGGPPCQAYSIIGRSRDKNKMKDDKRNYLYIYYRAFLEKYKPRYFIFENVTGLLSAKSKNNELYFNKMLKVFNKAGYTTEYKILSAEEYGVLQNRKRVILVGRRGKQEGFYPEPIKWFPDVKVNEIFKDLPKLNAGEGTALPVKLKKYTGKYLYKAGIRNGLNVTTWHWTRPNTKQDLKIYKIAVKKWLNSQERLNYNDLPEELKTHKNRESFTDRFKIVAPDLAYSHTVVAHLSKDGHYYIHPDIEQNRSITPREAARIQTFPDDYFFESIHGYAERTPVFRQIGNAVPVLLAQKIAEKLLEVW